MSAIFLENKQMTAGFDPETGKLISIRMKGDPLKTEYIGNRKNISYPSIREANQWMGDVRFRIWDETRRDGEKNGRQIPKITEL